MVLALHANFFSIGVPTEESFRNFPFSEATRLLIQMMSIVSVNVFVMISGWFGIKATIKSFGNFIFQCLFFLIGIYVAALAFGFVPLSTKGLANCLALDNGYTWFIRAYLGLFILSPVLNTFLKICTKRHLEYVLISFYIFQTIFGCVYNIEFICNGFSSFSFIGLYLLSRYIKLYGMAKCKFGWKIYAVSVFCNYLLCYLVNRFHITCFDVFGYSNPLVIIGAAGLIMWTAQLNIQQSRVINFIAASSFSVYLIHTNPNICDMKFKPFMLSVYEHFNGIVCLIAEFFVLALIFALAVILDQPRKWLWNFLWKKYEIIINKESLCP